MKIKQFRYAADNFSYLVYGRRSALVVDGGAVEKIKAFAATHHLQMQYVTNTHLHPDHTIGNRALLEGSKAVFLDPRDLPGSPVIMIDDEPIEPYHTPGHTSDSITFHVGTALITGDTLFNGTVGNCFSGDVQGFYHSIKKLIACPPETLVYAGHDYVRDSMAFARTLEPDNPAIDAYLQAYDPDHVYSRLADELRVNPYVRYNTDTIRALLKQNGLPVATEYERWQSIMSL